MREGTVAVAAALLMVGAAGATRAAPARDDRLWTAAQAARPRALDLLRQAVDIDSGTGDAPGAAKVQALFAPRLRALGARIETVPSESPRAGPNLLASFTGAGPGRLLIVAHVVMAALVAVAGYRTAATTRVAHPVEQTA